MDEQKLKVILEAEIDDAIGYVETETVEQRTKAINYYNRYEYGNEIDGRSKIVTGEVAEVVDGALPQLLVSPPLSSRCCSRVEDSEF